MGAQVVTADGAVVEAAGDPELPWGLGGAAADLGVVTRLDLRLHPHGLCYFWRSDHVAELHEGLIDALVDRAWSMRNRRSYTIVFALGAALAEPRESAASTAPRSSSP